MKRSPAILVTLVIAALTELFLIRGSPPSEKPASREPRGPAGASSVPVNATGPAAPPVAPRADRPPLPSGRPPRVADLPGDFLDRSVRGKEFLATLPDGREARGTISLIRHDAAGVLFVQGRLDVPEPGRFYFQRQTAGGIAGALVGNIVFDRGEIAWKIEPVGPGGSPQLVESPLDAVFCVSYTQPPPGEVPEEAPQTHPSNIPIPSYQTIIPLQSLPGATGVIYLDFDGEAGPFASWGDFDAAPSAATNAQIQDVWRMVSEDFQGFNLNITTDRKVFDGAPEGRRQHVVISPTATAAPSAGGVAYVGSFNWTGDTVCWAFYSVGKSAAEVISHEVGHTLGLSHDGRTSPAESYYGGHGSGSTGWAPIMGVGYYKTLSQWSKGEYLGANQTQDDLAMIVANNDVDYRADDAGETPATARYLEIAANDSVSGEGIIETTADVDAFRFATAGGTVALNVNPASSNPNLDILAELVDAGTGLTVASSNPELATYATLATNLAAGDYLLKICGTGRGDPLGDGYTDYGSLGTYLVSGSVAGGEKADYFTVAENTAVGAPVGSVAARGNHGGATLSWSITGGNSGGVFAMDPATGLLTVANAVPLDFEALSLRWDDPATLELFVTLADSLDPELDESRRVVVTIGDLNEAPTITGGSLTMLERTRVGTPLLTVAAADGDRFDFPVFSISAGNPDGWFVIDPATGELRVNGTIEVSGTTVVPLTVQATDKGAPALSSTATVQLTVLNIAAGYIPGGAMRTYFEGINGSSVSNLTAATAKWPNHPDSEEYLAAFDGEGHGDNFGSTVRAYLIPPATGSYRFWISSDDASALHLATSASPAGAPQIASVGSWTEPRSWPSSGSQQSSFVTLTAGQPYYIEARHKEGGGGDHLAVAWSGPGISKQLLSGIYLAPYDQNYAPKITAATFSVPDDAFAGQPVGTVAVTDVNAEDRHGGFTITGGNIGGVFAIDPSTGAIRVAGLLNAAIRPVYTLGIQAGDDGSPAATGSSTVTVNVLPAGTFPDNGIYQQVWTGLGGTVLATLTGSAAYPHFPDSVRTLESFDSGTATGNEYGSRIRALVVPPVTGSYIFHLSSDDDSRLLLGSASAPASASQIASITGYSDPGQWTKFASQQSAAISLVAGQSYYIETLHKEGSGGDHVQVGWTGPGISAVTVIPGSALRPYDINTVPVFAAGAPAFELLEGSPGGTGIGIVAATDAEGESPLHAITSGNAAGAFAIDAASGHVTVANSAAMVPGVHTLTVAAQDGGIGGLYPLKTATATVTVTVGNIDRPPAFAAEILAFSATEDVLSAGQLTATDPDAGDTRVCTRIAGPEWLSVAPDGALSGIPENGDVGVNLITVRVTDGSGLFDDATLSVTVANVNDAPVFMHDPIHRPGGLEGQTYTALSLAGSASDVDAGETPLFSLVAGPAWLVVAPDGSLSGMPPEGSGGANAFIVRATDPAGAFDEAGLLIEIATAGLPLPWDDGTVGSGLAGSSSHLGDAFQITGSGSLSGRNDSFQFVWQPLAGDGSITARLDAMEDTGPGSRAGIMIRDTLAPNSRHVFMGMTGDGGYRWVRRTGSNGNTSTSTSGSRPGPDAWVRLVRSGDTITAFKSGDGSAWTIVGSLTAALPPTCYFGLAVASGSGPAMSSAAFSQVTFGP